ncbi:hypothetical protein Hte_001160 [Hypoxylon texense]
MSKTPQTGSSPGGRSAARPLAAGPHPSSARITSSRPPRDPRAAIETRPVVLVRQECDHVQRPDPDGVRDDVGPRADVVALVVGLAYPEGSLAVGRGNYGAVASLVRIRRVPGEGSLGSQELCAHAAAQAIVPDESVGGGAGGASVIDQSIV